VVSTMWKEMQEDHLTNQQAIIKLTNAVHDGLAYGNWPWSY
jgi:hypothetical protein